MAWHRTALVCLWLCPLAVADQVGWHEEFQTDRGWRAERWQVSRPDENARTDFGSSGARFTITSPQAGMAWTRTVNPIWVGVFPILQVDCTCDGAPADGYPQIFLFDDSTGPVTPNALNPENPLAGEHEAIVRLSPEPGLQTFDLRKIYPSDRIGRISVRLAAADAPVSLVMRKIVFCAADLQPSDNPGFDSNSAKSLLSGYGIREPLWSSVDLSNRESLPLSTGIMEEESLRVTGRWRGSELALVLAGGVFGNEAPWYGSASNRTRKTITSPHQLTVDLQYEDGTRTSHFPWSVQGKAWQTGSQPAVYVVPVEPDRTLAGISVRDRMSYGQVFLWAAAINASGERIHPVAAPVPASRPASVPGIPAVPTRWSREGTSVLVENAWLRLRLDVAMYPKIIELSMIPLNRTLISPDSDSALFELQGNPVHAQLRDVQGASASDGVNLAMNWSLDDSKRQIVLKLHAGDDGRLEFSTVLRNDTTSTWNLALSAPRLRSVTVAAESEEASYLVGTRNALQASQDVAIDKPYGGPWPLALVDLFASRRGGGVGLFTVDPQVLAKTLRFKKTRGKADVAFSYEHLAVAAGGRIELPPTVILPHLGDWHDAFAAYRDRVRGTAINPAQHALTDTFYCRRDYPLGGTDYLFDVGRRTYTPGMLIEESRPSFGGLDLIDISGWAFHEKTGRVGDYLTNDLGGLQAVRDLTETAHEAGKKVGLYFEGFLIDRRSSLAAKALPAWQIIDKAGKPRWWAGEMEFFACPGVKEWRKELARAMAQVAAQTGVDAVYADEFGISTMDRACWSPHHGHPVPSNPLDDERAMLREIRAALAAQSPRTAVYTEYVPADGLAGLVDGAFGIGLFDANPGQHPTKLPLYRYLFPQIAVYQMVGHGIRPVPFEADDLHRAVFHGQGIWLKGRGDSWFTTELRQLAGKAYRMYDEHGDVLRSADCEPLIPTLQPDLFANRFSSGAKTIYTFYNASHSTIRGHLLQLPRAQGKVIDLLWDEEALITSDGILEGTVEPWSVSAYLYKPR